MKELSHIVAKTDPQTGLVEASMIIDGEQVVVRLSRSVAASAIEYLARALVKVPTN